MTLQEYLKRLQSHEEYAFSFNEILKRTDKTEASIQSELSRLVEKGVVVNLRKGFYVIIPPRYSTSSHVPIQLYVDKLFKHLNRQYYIGFYTAAKFHGAAHQQIQRDYVMTDPPALIDIEKTPYSIRFLTTSRWPRQNIIQRQSDAGVFHISSPALTMVDLIHYQIKLGGLNRMLVVLEELAEKLDGQDLDNLLTWYPNKSTLQRLGFVFDQIQIDATLRQRLFDYLKSTKIFPVLLSPDSKIKPGSVDNLWKVDVNIKIEHDL